MKYDQSYEDLLQYLSATGMFNLNSFNEWNDDLKSMSMTEGINLDFSFLESLIPWANPELGRSLQSLLLNIFKEDRIDKEESLKVESIPHYLPVKMCLLGKSMSGKRTIAKQIQDQYQGKIKIFKMEDIVKEALDYINPKPVVDAAPAKKAPPPKGKAEEP